MSDHAIEEVHPGAHVHEAGDHEHPGASVYILVAVVLIILTAMEIGVFYAPFLQVVLVPLLVILAVLKFILVAMFYMHLKYDNWTFTVLFGFPLALAALIITSLMFLFIYLGRHAAAG
ncbi:MAG TPA: cytochrome C oxidase subunit IV family protein [Candidatus Binataceae bacterium]|jgi:heme/copper-type cytochrome/quinol oxidase subunit 4|nr:cytochrome C oxidase subunit IV family protein [Candidatus Binataceae bacterium]